MRKVDVVIVSDLHLGTYGSHAKEFANYMSSIDPKLIILNGDIIDMWQFKKSNFLSSHWDAIRVLIDKASAGIPIYYLTGNHDDALRKFSDLSLGNFHLLDKLVLNIDDKKYWIFHGDVFDPSVNHSKWIAKLGGKAYGLLIKLNRTINRIRIRFNKPPISFSKKIKKNVKKAVKFINDFEQTAIDLAEDNDYDYVVCGHIHQPIMREVKRKDKKIIYLNSGDWVESLTALEYRDGQWCIFDYMEDFLESVPESKLELVLEGNG